MWLGLIPAANLSSVTLAFLIFAVSTALAPNSVAVTAPAANLSVVTPSSANSVVPIEPAAA